MSENLLIAKAQKRVAALLKDLQIIGGEEAVARLDAELSAAEERGRRAGIDEGFRRGVENAAQWLKISEPLRLAMHRALSDHAALAPRDSGKDTELRAAVERRP